MEHTLTLQIPAPMYLVLVLIPVFFLYNMYKNNVLHYLKGREDKSRFGDYLKRIKLLIEEGILLKRIRQDTFGGIFKLLILYSFVTLVGTKVFEAISANTPLNLERGYIALAIPLLQFVAGICMAIGLAMVLVRRFLIKPKYLENTGNKLDILFFGYVGTMVVLSVLLSGMKIYYEGGKEFLWQAPFGWAASFLFSPVPKNLIPGLFKGLWIAEIFVMAVGLMFIYTYSRLKHVFLIPANVFFSSLKPKGALDRFDIEEKLSTIENEDDFKVGNQTIKDLTWKQRLDLDACIECGRCERLCPSYNANNIMSPKKIISSLKGAMRDGKSGEKEIVGEVISEHDLWLCRTCRACQGNCPAYVEYVDQVMEIRRAQVVMKGQLPPDAARALKNLQVRGNPFGPPQDDRIKWIEEEKMPVIREGDETDILLWIGCCCTFDPTKHQIIKDLRKILDKIELSYGALGVDERCCGDPARILGDEATFQTVVKQQIELIQSRRFDKMLVICPHCYNVFKNEYPQFGAKFEVFHHTTFINDLIKSGKIVLKNRIEGKVAYHDSCYLGRYNDIYREPREVIKAIDGLKLVEFNNTRNKSFCCGGGGGHFWMDLDLEIGSKNRVNVERVKEVSKSDVSMIITSCVFCNQMLLDGLKLTELDEKMKIVDIATLVAQALEKEVEVKELPLKEKKDA